MKTSSSSYAISPFAWMMFIQIVTAFVYYQVKIQPWLIQYIATL